MAQMPGRQLTGGLLLVSLSQYAKRADPLALLVRNLDGPLRLGAQLAVYVFKGVSGRNRGFSPSFLDIGEFDGRLVTELFIRMRDFESISRHWVPTGERVHGGRLRRPIQSVRCNQLWSGHSRTHS